MRLITVQDYPRYYARKAPEEKEDIMIFSPPLYEVARENGIVAYVDGEFIYAPKR